MPGTSGETETEDAEGDRGSRGQEHASAPNIVARISQLADDHLTVVRGLSVGLAVAGVVVIARSVRLITKFQSAAEIPAHFFESNVSLRGKVHSITARGLQVEHVPIHIPLLSPLLSKRKGKCEPPLPVHLAGVELTLEGRQWLQENLFPAQTVWLKLISREDDALHCVVAQSKGSMWSYSINEKVLMLGLARTAPIAGLVPDSRLRWRLRRRLHKAEVKAERKGRGLWKEDGLLERISKALRDNLFSRLLRRLFRRT